MTGLPPSGTFPFEFDPNFFDTKLVLLKNFADLDISFDEVRELHMQYIAPKMDYIAEKVSKKFPDIDDMNIILYQEISKILTQVFAPKQLEMFE